MQHHGRYGGLVGSLVFAAAAIEAVHRNGPHVIVIDGDAGMGSRLLSPDEIAALKTQKVEPKRPSIRLAAAGIGPKVHKGEREKTRRLRQLERAAAKKVRT